MKPLGLSIDWSREFATCDPEYYGQQQALFLDMLEAGLAYRKSATVNWDPVDMTVLANEQVIDGKGWRSGAAVERRELVQWFFAISDMAGDLLDSLDGLDDWPDKVRLMQANWIGRSRGLEMTFDLTAPLGDHDGITVYTTRPDTLRGASFIAIAPEHPLARTLAQDDADLAAFAADVRKGGTTEAALETAEKRGYDTGLTVANPLGGTLPVWVANFVLMDYGTGAIFGCPAHDQRDLDFARKYDLPVIATFAPRRCRRLRDRRRRLCPAEDRTRRLYRQPRGRDPRDRQRWHRSHDRLGRSAGDGHGQGAVPPARLGAVAATLLGLPHPRRPLRHVRRRAGEKKENLPIRLPDDVDFDTPGNPLDRHPTWRQVPCPKCGKPPGGRPTRWTPSSIRRGTSPASPRRVPIRRP